MRRNRIGNLEADYIRQASHASWFAPILAVVFNLFIGSQFDGSTRNWIRGLMGCFMVLAGFGFGLFAIIGCIWKREFRLGVIFAASIGLLINGFAIYGTILAFQAAANMANVE